MTKELNCRDDAVECQECGSNSTAMVRVVGHRSGQAVSCFDCPNTGKAFETMHEAVVDWNRR